MAKKAGLTPTPLARKKKNSISLQLCYCLLYHTHPNMVTSLSEAAKPRSWEAPSGRKLLTASQTIRNKRYNSTKGFPENKCQINPTELSLLPLSSVYANLFLCHRCPGWAAFVWEKATAFSFLLFSFFPPPHFIWGLWINSLRHNLCIHVSWVMFPGAFY